MSDPRFGVVVRVGEYPGNHAMVNPEGYVIAGPEVMDPPVQLPPNLKLAMLLTWRKPVFEVGEILVMDDNDRTVPDGRKPDKWDVTVDYFNEIEDAVQRSREACDARV